MARKKKEDTLEDFEAKENGQTSTDVPVLKKKRGRPMKTAIAKGLRDILEQPAKPIVIKSGSLRSLFCDYSYDHTVAQNTTNNIKVSSSVPVHEDLPKAFKKLHAHLAVICEEIHPDEIEDIDNLPELNEAWDADDNRQNPLAAKLAKFTVSSFRIAGNGENEGVVLTGQKQLINTKDQVQLTTPVTKFLSEYPFVNELRIAVDDLVKEIELYQSGRKQAPQRQSELPFGDNDDSFEDDEDI